jgi:hypothetical protein
MRIFEHSIDAYVAGWLDGSNGPVIPKSDVEIRSGDVPPEVEAKGAKMAQREFSGIE